MGCPFPHGSVLARRDVWRLLGGYSHSPATAHCEDFALWGTWLRFFKPAMVEESLYQYTVSQKSISAIYSEQQMRASAVVTAQFRALDPVERVPAALHALAEALGVSLREAGAVAYTLWTFRGSVRAPAAALAPLRRLMPDRVVIESAEGAGDELEIAQIIGRPFGPNDDASLLQVL